MQDNLAAVAFVILASICGAVKGQFENPCEKGIDLGLIVDRSKSVGKANFITVKNALKSFVDNFNITPETTHVSFIFFAGEALHLFNLTDPKYQSNGAVKKAIDAVPDKLYWGTRTDLALMKAHDHLFERGQDRRKRPNVLVVLTDGKSSPNSAPYSETVPPLEDKGVNIIAVGIGRGIDKEELEDISGERGSVVQVPDFDALTGKLSEILIDVCIINGGYTSWSAWSECSATCGDGIRTRSRNCTNPEPEGGGKNCDDIGEPEEQELCDLPKCDESIDGGYTRWTTWTECSKTCGGGQRIRFRSCTSPPPYLDGKNCDEFGDPQETLECNTQPCVKEPAPCEEGLDLGILIDQSWSIRKRNVERLFQKFMPSFFKKMKISKEKTRIGIITYNKDGNVVLTFNAKNSRSNEKATAFVKKLDPRVTFHTRTDLGLVEVYKSLFQKKYGDRKNRQNVLVTFTDGRAYPKKRVKPFSETVPPLTGDRKCHMVAVGYGIPSKINMTQLHEIAGDNVIKVGKPRRIVRMVKKVKKMVCSVDGGYSQWSMWSLCSATCGVGVKVRGRVCNSPPPRKGGKDCRRLGNSYETTECNEGECPKKPSPCESKKMDVCLIVDSSLSVKVPNFVRVKTFLTQFVHFFDATTHFSIITFAKYPVVRCRFSDKECQGPDGVHDLISTIPDKLYWGTFTDRALVEANQTVFIPENGDRSDASNVVMVITDGKAMKGSAPYNVTIPPLREGKNAKVVAFGVGPSIREEDLNEMAGEKNWFYVEDFYEMKERIPDILGVTCNETVSNPMVS